MIEGLYETHIKVANLERSIKFYKNVLGLEQSRYQDDRRLAFFWLGDKETAMLGLWEQKDQPVQRQHFAFRVSVENMKKAKEYLLNLGLTPRNFLDDGTQDPMVFAWMPAVAIYFRDPDGHSLEFIAMLPDEPDPEGGIVPFDEWEKQHGRA